MICERCHGRRFIGGYPCMNCLGGEVNCCDGENACNDDPYTDPAYTSRPCDRCGKWYRGPAVYCSRECAIEDA